MGIGEKGSRVTTQGEKRRSTGKRARQCRRREGQGWKK